MDSDTSLQDTYEISVIDGTDLGLHNLPETKDSELESATDEQSTDKPKVKHLIKYPSGFWEITFTDLGEEPLTDL